MGKRQDVNNRMFLRPSPNEETKLLQDETQKLRKLRLQQVRQQEKVLANRARKKFKEKEKKEIDSLENELKKKWEEDITEKKTMLENQYYENVAHVGESHQAALMCEDGTPKERSFEDEIRVSERYREALRKLREDDAEKVQILNEKTGAKNRAMEMERLRAARVAALEPPVPDIAQNLETIQKHKYKPKNIDQYSSTYYHIPQERIEKADPNLYQVDARHAAKEEEERLQNAKEETDRNLSEQMEKARLRHKHARSKLMLEKDHNKLLEELEHFERIDRQRRQEIVSKIPKHVFEPPHRRIEANEERQREIEHAFEDMYMAQTNYMGDISVAQDALPVSPAASDEEISVEREDPTSDDVQTEKEEDMEYDKRSKIIENKSELPGQGKRKFVEEAEKSRTDGRPSSKDPLKRLLKKIDIQRDRWKSNEMKTVKGLENRRNTEMIMPDNASEKCEGTLTLTTENSQSVSAESDVDHGQRSTLLHPHEEAERTRAATTKHIQIHDTTSKDEIDKQRQRLQQQKLKLQLQQQQVMQEHLQLQFDALGINEIKEAEGVESREDSSHHDSPTVLHKAMKDTRFPDLSSGLLSDDGKTTNVADFVDGAPISEFSEDDVLSVVSHTEESRVDFHLNRHDVLHSIPESVSEEDFVPLPPVSSATMFSDVSQPSPLHFVKSTKPGVTKPTPVESITRMSPSQLVSPTQYNTGLLPSRFGQLGLNVPLDEWSKMHPSLEMSPPHSDIRAVAHEAMPSSQIPTTRVLSPVTKETTSPCSEPIDQPAAIAVRYDNQTPFLFPRSIPPHFSTSEDAPPRANHERAVSSDTISPFIHFPSTISSTPFFPEGHATFQFPGNRETNTASYLHFYQQQLLEQQNRIREQQTAIQERQQQRLVQLKQFQARLRGQKHDTGLGTSEHTEERAHQLTGQWQSLIPSTRYLSDTASTNTDHVQSSAESVDPGISNKVHSDIPPLLEQPHLERSTTQSKISNGQDTSSSLSPYPSEVISVKDASLPGKPSDLGLWSDSTPQLSSSDATKSSSTTMEDSKMNKKDDEQSRPKVSHEFALSSSSVSNNGNASEANSSNRSSEHSSMKSGSSFESGPLSISSLPKSVDKSLSTGSSASDSNNNLLQRMESSFQHFQEMINEAKVLNEKYLDDTKHSVENAELEKRDSLENIQKKDNARKSGLDNIPSSKGNWPSRQINDYSPSKPAKGRIINDNLYQPLFGDTDEAVALEQQGRHKEDDMSGPSENNFEFAQMKYFVNRDGSTSFRAPLSSVILNKENFDAREQSAETEMINVDKEHQSYYDSSPRALSVIPEETRISDDDLSEGILEEEEPNMIEYEEDHVDDDLPLSHVPQPESYFTDVVEHGDEEFQMYGESKDFVSSPSLRQANYVPYRSPEQTLTQPAITTFDSSEEWRQSLEFGADSMAIQHTPETSQYGGTLPPGGIMTSAEASNKFGLHVDLPTTEKRSCNERSSTSPFTNDVVLLGLSSLSLSQTDESSTSGLSLQDAFCKSRPEFLRHSEERVLRAKEARYRQSHEIEDDRQGKPTGKTKHNPPETSPISSKPHAERIVGKLSPDDRHKIGKEEMKDRTKRLYQNLPDIRQKEVEKEREQIYATNRAKAQEFQKQTRERLRKLNAKKTGKKT